MFRSKNVPPPTGTGPAITLDKVPPGLVSLTKSAAVSLEKSGLTGQRAAVYLVLDHSGSMHGFYKDGSVQRLAEQALGLSANLDDDGTVPLIYFGTVAERPVDVRLHSHTGVIDATHTAVRWGTTNYGSAMRSVIAHYQRSGATDPALVIFQSDGAPDSKPDAKHALQDASSLPIFWAFVGYGERIEFLEKLDDLRGRKVDNASFFHARDPHTVSDADLYDGITHEYAGWLAAASAAGIIR
ncbi:toxic cation resistance protein [Streptomyces sp. WAC 01529]|uniref:VWA domain-containing protein n=1 Tax=Streptomyces sp. WAC 01529 TaxID=2203205 RepID=UPI000F6C4C29|nr:VWA domain-containing protein [Streptomyces sp. WAC 01529]AZM51817.1 toxic cation resistance protein [Streptomyces sp. WAC 01529]